MKQKRVNATLIIAALALTTLLILTALSLAGVFPLPASAGPFARQGENVEPAGQVGGDTHVTAAVIYVPDDYPTIQAAVDAASPGDAIIVRDGTYTENVDVNKEHLTIESENGADSTIVQATNPEDRVFEVTANYVEISGFTIKGVETEPSKAGIYICASYCTLTNNTVSSNLYGIHLDSSSNNTLANNIVDSNVGDGIRLTSSNNNTITNNSASHIHWGYGIYLWTSSNNTITGNVASSNGCVGIWLSSWCSNNTIADNTVSYNNFGIRLSASNSNNTISSNTINSNRSYGICLWTSNNNTLYLNNFSNTNNVDSNSTNIWNSPEEITYAHNGNIYTNHLGSYWSDYTGSDADGDGIGDIPYSIDSDSDNCPLMQPFENYREIGYAVIVAGQADWRLKWAMDHSANNAYRALRNLGFDDDHIFYLNTESQQIDGQNVVDKSASLDDLRNSLDEIKHKIGDSPTPLILYLVGHGIKEVFDFYTESDALSSTDLREMLEPFHNNLMLIVIGSCYSGSFITLDYFTDSISGNNRIIITATHDDQVRLSLLGLGGWFHSSDRFWGNLNKGLNVKDAFVTNAWPGEWWHLWLDDNGDAIGHPPNSLGNDGELAAATQIGVPGTENLRLTPWISVGKRSPGELRVYDSENRVTGLVNGEVKEEIPNSIYDQQDEIVAIFSPSDTYRYQVVSMDEGIYGLDVASIKDGEATTFIAIDIPTSANATHQYTFDWDALSQGEEGVIVQVDSDGDGEFEHHFTADNDLTQDEFIAGTTPSTPVGGVIIPVSKLELLVPWIGLVLLALLAGLLLVKRIERP